MSLAYKYLSVKKHLLIYVVLIFSFVNGIIFSSGVELVDVDLIYINLLLTLLTIFFFIYDFYRYIKDVLKEENLQKQIINGNQQLHEMIQGRKELDDYLSKWIHEIKVPISVARLICEEITDEKGPQLNIELDRINMLSNQLLFVNRFKAAEKDIKLEEVDVLICLQKVVRSFKRLLIHKNISVDIDIINQKQSDDCVKVNNEVITDSKWIEYIFSQIIHNSYKYVDNNGHISIVIEHTATHILIRITDNGIGIKQSEISQIFNKGYIGSNGRNSEQSTGFGLYISREISHKLNVELTPSIEGSSGFTMEISIPKESLNHKILKEQ